MVKKSLLAIQKIVVWLIGICVALMLICALFVQFWLFPNINQYKDHIAKALSQGLQQQVTIGGISANWKNLQPSAVLDSIVILDAENRPALSLKQSEIVLSWLSFIALEPRFADINIYSPHLEIRRTGDGAILVAGIQVNRDDNADPAAANWVLRQSAIHIIDATLTWTDELRNSPALQLEAVNIAVTSPPWKKLLKNHHILISAQPTVGTKKPIKIAADIYGNDVSQFHTWRGKISFAIQNTNLIAFKPWLDYPFTIERGYGSLVSHIQFSQNQITAFAGDVKIKHLLANLPKAASGNTQSNDAHTHLGEIISIDSMSALLDWSSDARKPSDATKSSDVKANAHLQSESIQSITVENTTPFAINTSDYRLTIKSLNLTLQNREALSEASAAVYVKNQQLQTLETHLAFANIAVLNDVLGKQLANLALPKNLQSQLIQSAPKGELSQFSALWKLRNNLAPLYKLSTEFKGLSVNPSPLTKIGFAGLEGKINLDEQHGRLNLSSQNASLELKDILRWPLLQNKLAGIVNWRVMQPTSAKNSQLNNSAVIDISTQGFAIQNPHLMGKVNASYRIDAKQGDYMDISGQFEKAQAKYATFYYPTTLSAATLNWLDTSILGGEVNDIQLTIKGKVRDFPFVNKERKVDSRIGLFSVTGHLTNGLLEYGSAWPKIERLNTSLLFEGTRMELNATAGRILGNEIIKSRVTIAELDADYPILEIDSEAKGPLAEGIRFVNKSPVAEITQGFTKDLVTSGQGKLDLKLNIPLENIDVATIKGRYEIKNASMQSASIPAINNINGVLKFTEKDLTATNVKAMIFGAPTAFSVATNPDKSVRIAAKGILNETSINQFVENASQYISGSSQWVANILIKNQIVNLAIRSDLFGIASTLPPPLNKLANERFNLRIDQKQLASTELTRVQFNNILHAKTTRTLRNNDYQLEQLSVHFGELNTTNGEWLTNDKGLSLTGQLATLDLDAWLAVNQQLSGVADAKRQASNFNLAIQKLDLNINTLEVFDKKIHQLNIKHKPAANGLQASVRSQELTGDLQWLSKANNTELTSPQANGKLVARLSQLIIPNNPENTGSTDKKSPAIKKDFYQIKQDYPALDITAANFELGNKKLGALTLNAYPQADNWVIQKLILANPDSILNVDGEWNNWVRSPNTRLNVTWDIKDLGNTIKRFGYPDAIKDGEGQLSGQLNWPGSPHDFNTVGLNGNLAFAMRDGQILKVQPGVGRLFGLLSLQSLPRRLTLDFRDLFNSGFAFDTIKANVKIANGVLFSDNFAMAGPAADVTIKGQASIPDETQLMRVKVNPRISDSVSLAALAGGPLVGAMAFLAQKILRDPLNKIASTEYNIGGTWDEPIELDEKPTKNTQPKQNVLQ